MKVNYEDGKPTKQDKKKFKKPKTAKKPEFFMACEYSQVLLDEAVARLEKEGYKKDCKQLVTQNNRYDRDITKQQTLYMQSMKLGTI